MQYLYHKFIKVGSDHEINLSHDTRAHFYQYFEVNQSHLNEKKESFIFNIFDECALNVLNLMMDAFHRFVLTEEYQHIVQDINWNDLPIECGDNTPQSDSGMSQKSQFDVLNEIPIIRNATSFNKLHTIYDNH